MDIPPKQLPKPWVKPGTKPKLTRGPRVKIERTPIRVTPAARDLRALRAKVMSVAAGKADPRSALKLRAQDASGFAALASTWLAEGDVESALAAATLGVTCDSENFDAQYAYGTALAKAKQDRDAIAALIRATRMRPEHLGVHVSLGELMLRVLDYAGASEEFRLVLEMDPKGDTPEGARAQALVAKVLMTLG